MSQPTPTVHVPDFILRFLESKLGASTAAQLRISSLKSAQQQMLVLSNIIISPDILCQLPNVWNDALKVGRNRLVVRIWKGSSCWWNLHRNEDLVKPTISSGPDSSAGDVRQSGVAALACSEVSGYRIARTALSRLHIPAVLYFSHDNLPPPTGFDETLDSNSTIDIYPPWAIFAHVGYDSEIFSSDCYQPDLTWMQSMVTTRLEFGFNEPHPRWGRVPVDQSLEYALSVVRNVTIPLHRYMHRGEHPWKEIESLRGASRQNGIPFPAVAKGITYQDMVAGYENALAQMMGSLAKNNNNGELGNQNILSNNLDSNLEAALELLGKAIDQLTQPSLQIGPLHPVLCHMDCQPQNLLFAKAKESDNKETSISSKTLPQILSVLDWEEAAFADLRFDLLLLCRKVCANREQAETVWKTYAHEYNELNEGISMQLGPLQPWLALETVHSLTTLLLQSMNLLGGGRNPWETEPDLWGKIQREIERLVQQYG